MKRANMTKTQGTALKTRQDTPLKLGAYARATIQQGGDLAADRMLELLQSGAFNKLRGSDQISLIKLAMDRAYGAVENNSINKSLSVNLTSSNSDAVANAMKKLANSDLPERGQNSPLNMPANGGRE